MSVKKPTGDLKKACWKGYTAVGTKMKNGRKVPNCVPVSEESNEPKDREWGTTKLTKRYKKDTPGQCDCNTMKEESDQITEDAKRDRVSADLHKQGIGSHWRNPQTLVVHDKHKKKVQQHMDKITGGWVHVVGHSEEPFDPMNEEAEKQTHLVKVTVSEPSLKSAEPMLKGVRVRATSEGEAIKRAKSHFRKAGYKVHDAYHHSTITTVKKAGQMDEGITKKINKRMKNTLSAMRGRASLGAPEKGLSWQQNKAKAIKAGRAMAKEEFKAGDKVHLGLTTKGGSGMIGTLRKIEGGTAHIEVDDPTSKYGPRIVKGKVSNLSMKEEAEQISEGPQRDATRAKNKLKDAIAGANYKRTGAPVPNPEPQHKTTQAHNKAIGRSLRKMEEGTRDLTAALAKKIEKKTGGKETAVRNKAGLLVPAGKPKAKLEEATGEDVYKDLRAQGVPHHAAMSRAREHEEKSKSRDYQGYHTQIHVDGRHYKGGDRMGAGERGAQDAAKHAANIAKKTGKKVSIHMIHHETGKTLAIADHTDGKWKYRNLSEAAPVQKKPKAGVEKLVSKMNPDTKAKTVSETRNIIREVIKKAVDKQETNKANGKTATGEAMPKVKIDPTIDLGARNV